MIVLIDNFDSFVHNLARYFQRLGQSTLVIRNNAITVAEVQTLKPEAIVLSPGPCTPNEAGCSLELVRTLGTSIPMLGVCLGHQTLGAAWGGKVIRAPEPMHGRTSVVKHIEQGLFTGLPNPMTVCRYHSLVLEEASLPAGWQGTAWTADDVLMAMAHRELPLFGVQFHPEAVLTEAGYPLLANFLRLAGLAASTPLPTMHQERPVLPSEEEDWSNVVYTF